MTGIISQKMNEVAEQLKCPITQQQMIEPHTLYPCNHTFEGAAILSWLKVSRTCPLDRTPVTDTAPNIALGEIVRKYEILKSEDSSIDHLISLENEISKIQHEAFSASQQKNASRIDTLRKQMHHSQEVGLYLLGNCVHEGCFQKDLPVTVFKGTGQFSMNKESATTLCQDCNYPISIDAIAIRSNHYQLEGMKIFDDSEEITIGSSLIEDDKIKMIFPLSEWRFLEATIPDGEAEPMIEKTKTIGIFSCLKNSAIFQWIKKFHY